MFQDPDTEVQYRKGGKIMKKTPRKFQAGGATPAPSPDRVPPAEAAKMKAEKEQQRREAATQKKGAEKPDLGKLGFKKGGKVRKFADGGGIEAKGKTAGKIVKMATGGSVRGYGISKVTNKTKYC